MSDIVSGSALEVITTESVIDVVTTESAIDVVTSGGVIDVPSEPTISLDGVENGLQDILEELQNTHSTLLERFEEIDIVELDRFEKIEEWLTKFDKFFVEVYEFYQNFVDFISEHSGVIVGVLLFFLMCFVIWLVYKLFRIFF